ncbi:sugar phosphate isomerase/epimerase family protein [Naasia aerilata]|uniref:Xylose isomerase n=1 Tax=Naasia aerilata TaxID=1162966 RepID=A0ABM8G7I5_9MICO|nr:TIM barrel protein [Naasia aerilata]BDZ44095.1 xylose isomerase [Naasia aerilata]BDZ47707.1 xylose isomerase [Naasia aerilata]
MTSTPLLGTTLYSFTNEWVSARYTLTELLEHVAAAGIGPGVELVGFQSIRNFPRLETAFIDEFHETVDRLGLVPTSLAANIDIAIRRDRDLTTEERVDYTAPQIEAARLLGFPVVRIQIGADPATLERLVPYAEKAGVRLGMEIHAPEGPLTPKVEAVSRVYDRIDSDLLGFIPDFSSTMHRISAGLAQTYLESGLPADLLPELQRIWAADGGQGERLGQFIALAESRGVPAATASVVASAFTMNGHERPEDWAELMPRIFHVHAKFYDIDENGEEPSIDYFRNLGPILEAGFAGSISSEWEAHSWTPNDELDTAALIRRQHDLMRRVIAKVSR